MNSNQMTKSKFIKRKKPSTKKVIFYVILLGIIILIWKYLDELMELIF